MSHGERLEEGRRSAVEYLDSLHHDGRCPDVLFETYSVVFAKTPSAAAGGRAAVRYARPGVDRRGDVEGDSLEMSSRELNPSHTTHAGHHPPTLKWRLKCLLGT